MNIEKYITYIKNEIKQKREYDEYVHVFKEYREFLEEVLAHTPNDIVAICQLAITCFELREGVERSIYLLENLLENNLQNMTDDEKSRVYTNLAYFCDEAGEKERCFEFLQNAVHLNSLYPNSYNQLATIYYTLAYENDLYYHGFDKLKEYKTASSGDYMPLFEKACTLSHDVWYRYNYGVGLYSMGEYEKARCQFEEIVLSLDIPIHLNFCVNFAYGMSLYFLNEHTKALEIMKNLEHDDNANLSDVADFYFLCGNFQKYIDIMDEEKYVNDVRWLSFYFYSLKETKKLSIAYDKFCEIIKEIEQNIKDIPGYDEYAEEEKQECIEQEQQTKQQITEAYYRIINGDLRPQVNIVLNLNFGCYLIDCPRCQGEL